MSKIVVDSICQIVDESDELFCCLMQVDKIENEIAFGVSISINSEGDDVSAFKIEVPIKSLAFVGIPKLVVSGDSFKRKTENLTFGQALLEVKEGNLIARAGWNGKNMFVFLRPEQTIDIETLVHIVKTVPQGVRDYYAQLNAKGLDSSMEITFTGYLCMKAADNSIVNGWLASQTDMLAEDWCIVNFNN